MLWYVHCNEGTGTKKSVHIYFAAPSRFLLPTLLPPLLTSGSRSLSHLRFLCSLPPFFFVPLGCHYYPCLSSYCFPSEIRSHPPSIISLCSSFLLLQRSRFLVLLLLTSSLSLSISGTIARIKSRGVSIGHCYC